jgi:hypothetical protein
MLKTHTKENEMIHLTETETRLQLKVLRRGEICGIVYDEALARLIGAGPGLIQALQTIADTPSANEHSALQHAVETARAALAALDSFDTEGRAP